MTSLSAEMNGTSVAPPGTVLDIQHLYVEYLADSGTVHALTDVSLRLERGQIVGLAGESGSGKSTLAYAVARLLRPPAVITGGQAFYYPRYHGGIEGASESGLLVDGLDLDPSGAVDVLTLTPAQLRTFRWEKLALVFQSAMNALNPVLTVHAQIDDVLRQHQPGMSGAQRQSRATELLRLVGISPDRLKSYPHELSGGMRQRAVIAIALALNPEVIILDEPTTALDVVVQRDILRALLALRKEFGFAAIFITHDLSLLLEIADRIAIMYAGRIVESGTSTELKRSPRHPYTYGMLNSFPTIHGPRQRMTGIPGSPPDLRELPTGCAFHPRCPLAFAACSTALPLLRPVAASGGGQRVACHLYDSHYTAAEPPTTADFAAGYRAAYASASGERTAE
jgi:peptide/nickel transport system ATP-binding protein